MPLSRRQFVVRSSAAMAALTVASPFALAASRPAARMPFEEIRRGVGVFTQRGGTIGYLATDATLAMVDAQFPEQAQMCYDGLDERTPGRASVIDLLVNTHHHGDHTAGNSVLGPLAARHVAHEAVPGLQRAAAVRYDALDSQAYARETYADRWSARVGDETISLHYFGPAHTAGDSVVHFEQADVVHMGDLVFNRRPPFIDLAAGATTAGWIGVLEAVHHTFGSDTVFIFGHAGEGHAITGTHADLLVMRDLLAGLNAHVAAGLAAGRSEDEIAVDVLPDFPDHSSSQQSMARAIRAVIEEQQR